jgi:hypothetical protein
MKKFLMYITALMLVLIGMPVGLWFGSPALQAETTRITNLIVSNITAGTYRLLAVAVVDSSGNHLSSFGGDGAIEDGDAAGEADVIATDPVGTEQGLVVRVTGLTRDCDDSISISDAVLGDSQIIPLVSGEDIIICNVTIVSGSTTANNVRLVYGTGSDCATGQTGLTGLLTLDLDSSLPGIIQSSAGGLYFVPTSNALCLEMSGSTQISGSITFVQYDTSP